MGWYHGEYAGEPGMEAAAAAGEALYAQAPTLPPGALTAAAEPLVQAYPETSAQLLRGMLAVSYLRARALARRG